MDEGLSMENAIEIRHLAYSYPDEQANEHVVFQDLSLDIEQGSFVAVLGHNGCGKSTLAKHLNAILLPEGGTVTVYGLDTKQEENLLAIRQQVGMVSEDAATFRASFRPSVLWKLATTSMSSCAALNWSTASSFTAIASLENQMVIFTFSFSPSEAAGF